MSAALSIIIPLAPGETMWRQLLPLIPCDADDEIIIAAAESPPQDWQENARPPVRWLHCKGGSRAALMNEAARAANNDFLWFVHADSRPAADAPAKLHRALAKKPDGIHYFNLRFYDGGWKMRINEFGVRWRCRLFSNPFGDQALCLSKTLFAQLGEYDEQAAYGEDHLLVLRARRRGIAVIKTPATVATSARRYQQHGWWQTICLYQKLWWRQWRQ